MQTNQTIFEIIYGKYRRKNDEKKNRIKIANTILNAWQTREPIQIRKENEIVWQALRHIFLSFDFQLKNRCKQQVALFFAIILLVQYFHLLYNLFLYFFFFLAAFLFWVVRNCLRMLKAQWYVCVCECVYAAPAKYPYEKRKRMLDQHKFIVRSLYKYRKSEMAQNMLENDHLQIPCAPRSTHTHTHTAHLY